MNDPTREELIDICHDGVVPVKKWLNRDTPRSQQSLGEAGALLAAGCEYRVLREPGGLCTDDNTIWIEITFPGFAEFDYDGGLERETYYLPTRQRLVSAAGSDWY